MHVLIAIFFRIVVAPSWADEAIITDGDTLILNGNLYLSMESTPPRHTRCASRQTQCLGMWP